VHCRTGETCVDAKLAEAIKRRPGVLTIEEPFNQDGLGEDMSKCLLASQVPGPASHLNTQVPPRSSDPDLEEMKKELEILTAQWGEKEGQFDLRSVGMKAPKKRLADLAAKIEEREAGRPGIAPTEYVSWSCQALCAGIPPGCWDS
jgi:hypothetical protein